MADIILKFANDVQYQQFLAEVKSEVKKQVIEELQTEDRVYSRSWIAIRDENDRKMRTYAEGCGHWHNCYQSFNAMFRLAFKAHHLKALSSVDGAKLRQFNDELYALIDKYREEAK